MKKILKDIEESINKKLSSKIYCRQWRDSIVLEGEVDNWHQVITAGKIAAGKGFKGVVNKIQVKDLIIPPIEKPILNDSALHGRRVDVLIIGGGVIGSAIGRELARYNISILLVEKEDDVAVHASSRNDGMIHPGIASKPGSKKGYYNVKGNKMYTKIAEELDVEFKRRGNIILYEKHWMKVVAPIVYNRAKKLGVEGVTHVPLKELRKLEPNITEKAAGGFSFPTTGILSPYKMTVAFAENAVMNGLELSLNTIVESIEVEKNKIEVVNTNRGKIYPSIVINAAGVYSDKIAEMAGDQFFTIHPRKGEVLILDKKKGELFNRVLAMPSISQRSGNTKGGGLVRTIDDNILAGPDAYEQPLREDYSSNRENIEGVINKHLPLVKGLYKGDIITYFTGIRAATYEEEFIVEKSEYIHNLIHAAGIQSPGLASAPAIAEDIASIAIEVLSQSKNVYRKVDFNPIRKGIPDLSKLSFEERSKIIKNRPDYGVIICRCEEISKGEIIDVLNSPVKINSLDAIKRRVRAGMGRCQGGFCTPLITEIISEEANIKPIEVTKKGRKSNILVSETKVLWKEEANGTV
ncbi:NAD(P)/FAD-dependent oxidoreductase [uncultured Clostridium sp.]|uniref:NAD(P)/FAD-dependent oxidoreductase n=1 Tax=uncultured Clostridium sp. TaxID=59620 RepID=UPI0028EA73AD|nr:NAD(P)/FAD-dependent oxidoreductase [uncultured Clostridium sp.]